jgi:polyisoprenoid-binding protein YceI
LGHSPTFAVRKFTGDIQLEPDGAAPSGALRLNVDSGSIELQDELSARDRWDILHLMQDEILEISKYPEIVYDAPTGRTAVKPSGGNQYEVSMKGDLSLHGVTRPHPVIARVLVHGDGLRASGEIPISQPDYKLKSVTVAGSMMKVKEEVKLTFDIVARK